MNAAECIEIPAKRHRLRRECEASLMFYTRLSDPRYEASAVHHLVAERLQGVKEGKTKRLILNMPPQHGKSRLTAVELPTWLLGMKPDRKIVVASYSADLSSRHSKLARARIAEPFYRTLFPECRLVPTDRAAHNWTTTAGGSYKAVGVGGSLTGHGADLVIIDDPFKDFADAHSPTMREKVWEWFLSVAFTRLAPDGAIVIIMTRWHVDDLVGRLLDPERVARFALSGLDTQETWETINLPALALPDDPIDRPMGEALFPEKFDVDRLRGIRQTVGSYMWSALYEGQPVPRGGNYVNAEHFKLIGPNEIPLNLHWMRFWDLAASTKLTADFTAGVQGALGKDGEFYLRDMAFGRWDWPTARKKICSIGEAEGVTVGVEAVGGFKTSFENLRETMPSDIPMREIGADKDKLTRALPWIALAEAGKVFLVSGHWNSEFMLQAEAFPNGKHDDLVDGVSGVYQMLKKRRRILVA
jgi:predicted phage terminase large subunit-like protein